MLPEWAQNETVVMATEGYGKNAARNGNHNIVIPFSYDSINIINLADHESVVFIAQKGQKYALISSDGIELTEFVYDRIYNAGTYIQAGLLRTSINGRYGFINIEGKQIVPEIYSTIGTLSDGMMYVETPDNSFTGFIDVEGERLVTLSTYENSSYERFFASHLYSFHDDMLAVKRTSSSGWGYINKTGVEVIPMQYEEAGAFSCGLARVKKNGLWGYIDSTGNEIIPCVYKIAQEFQSGYSFVAQSTNYGECALINTSGEILTQFVYDHNEYNDYDEECIRNGLIKVRKGNGDGGEDNGYGLIDVSGSVVVPCNYYAINSSALTEYGLLSVQPNRRESNYRIIDLNNNVIAFSYNKQPYIEEGVIITFGNGVSSAYYRDLSGKLFYSESGNFNGYSGIVGAMPFSEGLSVLHKMYQELPQPPIYSIYVYINKSGDGEIEGLENHLYYSYNEGLARFYNRETQKYGFINKDGVTVIPAIFNSAQDFSSGLSVVAIDGKNGVISFVEEEPDTGEEDDNDTLKILSFDWIEPDQTTYIGTSISSGISTYVFETNVYAHKIYLTVTNGAEWVLYKNPECTETVEKNSTQYYTQLDTPYLLYIKLTKEGHDDAIYGLEVTRREILMPAPTYEIEYFVNDKDNVTATKGIKWGAELFNNPSSAYDSNIGFAAGYNHDIALAAAVLTAAGDNKKGEKIVAAYKELGFEDDNIALYSYPDNSKNQTHLSFANDENFAFSIAHQTMMLGNGETDIMIITLRGTKTDWETKWVDVVLLNSDNHINFYGYQVYQGYSDYFNDVKAGLIDYMNRHPDLGGANGDKLKFLIAGHSLGGAVAQLLAAHLNNLFPNLYKKDIYAYTYGALNTIKATKNGDKYYDNNPVWGGYENIFNIFNYYDSFGPSAGGVAGVRPAMGGITIMNKFGNVFQFLGDYEKSEKPYKDNAFVTHIMAGYVDAIFDNLSFSQPASRAYRISSLCPVDIEVYDSSDKLVARTVHNIIDEDATKVPMFIYDEHKFLLLSFDEKYTINILSYDFGEMSCLVEPVGGISDNTMNGVIELKMFENVTLVPGKRMHLEIDGNKIGTRSIQLFVVDRLGEKIAEIHPDGSETNLIANEDDAIVSADKAALTWNAIRGSNVLQTSVVSNLTLPTKGANGSIITWSSSIPATISTNGTVNRPAYGSGNRTAVLTATITSGEASDTMSFEFIIIEQPDQGSGTDPEFYVDAYAPSYIPPVNIPPLVKVDPVETPAGSVEWQNPYIDVNERDWYYEALKYVTENGIMVGTGGNKFSPNINMTRAMLVQTLYSHAGKPSVNGSSPFTDVTTGNWYTDAISWAANEEMVFGYGNGLFGPDDFITREQIAAILCNYAKSRNHTVNSTNDLSGYTDINEISDWALLAVQWAVAEEIIVGRSLTSIAPKGNATRAEVVTMFMRVVETKLN